MTERRSRKLPRWALWQVPRRALGFILAVEAMAVAVTVAAALRGDDIGSDVLATFGVILGLGIGTGEMSRHVERVRRRFSDTPHVNLTSVWIIPAALLLPALLVAAVAVALYLHLFWRSWYRVRGVHAYRLTFSGATVVLASYATWGTFNLLAPDGMGRWNQLSAVVAVVLALLAYSVVNSGLVGTAICLFEGRLDVRRAWGTGRENALEYGTLGLGATTALLLTVHLAWPLLMIPGLLVLHRSVLMRQLEEAAATDPKTGLTNATAWTNAAAKELGQAARAGAGIGVLMIDLDHFKAVNDGYGHVAGDEVLQAVADTIVKAVRRHDLTGRWGGEEFVVLCPDVSAKQLLQVGERICELVRNLRVPVSGLGRGEVVGGLTVSVGAAAYPEFGPELQDVLLAADDALFVAKDKGRDQVRSIVSSVGGLGDSTAPTRP